jgi:hypothetical protein
MASFEAKTTFEAMEHLETDYVPKNIMITGGAGFM